MSEEPKKPDDMQPIAIGDLSEAQPETGARKLLGQILKEMRLVS